MNKNFLLTAFLGTLALFAFSMFSWMLSPIHNGTFKGGVPNADSVLNTLSTLDDGVYSIPYTDPDLPSEEKQKAHREAMGKPFVLIHYSKAMPSNMGMQMIKGFILNLLSLFIVLYIIRRSRVTGFVPKFFTVFLFGIFLVCQSNLLDMNWWCTPLHFEGPEIIDNIGGWAVTGLVVAWIFKQEELEGSAI